MIKNKLHCGYVAIVGRPNVGKSTLLNKFIKKKLSITSKKAQTTQKQIIAVKTTDDYQIVFVDTPGLHQNLISQQKNTLSKYMSRAVTQALADVDLVLFVISGTKWTEEDEFVLEQLKLAKISCMLIVNKIDLIKDKAELLPFVQKIISKANFLDVYYVSALKDEDVLKLEQSVAVKLPEVDSANEYFYAPDYETNQNSKSLAAEIIREKIIRLSNKEIPYGVAIEIEQFEHSKTKAGQDIINIGAIIWVERKGQKLIVIGSKGEVLKNIGTQARQDLEKLFKTKVHLSMWVKIKSDWSSDTRILKQSGFEE